jgi:hypothetical protein
VLGDHDGDGVGIEDFEDVRDIAGVGDVVAGMQFDGVFGDSDQRAAAQSTTCSITPGMCGSDRRGVPGSAEMK